MSSLVHLKVKYAAHPGFTFSFSPFVPPVLLLTTRAGVLFSTNVRQAVDGAFFESPFLAAGFPPLSLLQTFERFQQLPPLFFFCASSMLLEVVFFSFNDVRF